MVTLHGHRSCNFSPEPKNLQLEGDGHRNSPFCACGFIGFHLLILETRDGMRKMRPLPVAPADAVVCGGLGAPLNKCNFRGI